MKKSTRITLLVVAGILILGGLTAAILSLVMDKPASSQGNDGTTQAGTTAAASQSTDLDLIKLIESGDSALTVEYTYDALGKEIVSEKYYYNGTYCGQRFYYSVDKEDHSILYNASDKEIGSSKTTYNIVGSIAFIEEYANGKLIKTTEYDYYEDLRTPKKKTFKDMSGDVEEAQVTRFNEKGQKTEVVSFSDGKEIEKIVYDENGNVK